MRTTLTAIATALTLAALSPATSDAQGIEGSWIAEVERRVENNNGEISAGEKSRVRLTLQQKGDSVFGTFQSAEVDSTGKPRGRVQEMRGTVAGDKVTLAMTVEAQRRVNDEVEVMRATLTYTLTLSGNRLDGTYSMKSGDMEMPPRPFSATRESRGA